MKVLVTGGTGFTGSNLIKKLCSQGVHVKAIVRDKSKMNIFDRNGVEVVEGDITDPVAVDRAVKGVEKVFHIAAVFRTAAIRENVYSDVHVKGTENLLNSSLKYNVSRFIHCSTGGVHGHIENPPASETYRFKPGDIYQITKLKGELTAVKFGNENKLPLTVIRPSPIYGPGDMRLLKLFKMALKKYVLILGPGNVFYHMVYIDDLVDAFLLASENENAIGETFIIGGEEILSLNEIVDLIAEGQNLQPVKIHLPAKPFQLLGSVCERICVPLKIEPPIYRRRVDFFTKSRSFDIRKAKNLLEYKPKVSLKEGLSKTSAWYKEQGYLRA